MKKIMNNFIISICAVVEWVKIYKTTQQYWPINFYFDKYNENSKTPQTLNENIYQINYAFKFITLQIRSHLQDQ